MSGSSSPLVYITYQAGLTGKISNAQPGVFFYYVQLPAQTSSCFSVEVQQSVAQLNGPLFQVQQAQRSAQVNLYSTDCSSANNLVKNLTMTDGGATFNVCGAVPGRTYIISVKYNTKTIIGAFDPAQTCDYTFKTLRNGVVVDEIDNALHLVKTSK
jgi:hypothetical protein